MDTLTAAHTHLLGRYRADGVERHVLALEDHGSDVRVTCLGEARAIADDYIVVAEKLGYPPMPDGWW